MSSRTLALLAIIIASLLWGTAGVVAKVLVRDLGPFTASFYRFLVASLLALPFFLRAGWPRGAWRDLGLLSMFGAANILLFYLGIKTTTANAAALIYAATPLTTALCSKAFIGEQSSREKLLGIGVGLVGVIVIVLLPLWERNQKLAGDVFGNLLIACAMISWTLYSIGTKRFANRKTYSPMVISEVYFVTTTVLSFIFALWSGERLFTPKVFTVQNASIILYAGMFITLITFFLFQWAIQRISVTTASLKNYLEPPVSIFFNSLLLGERISAGFVWGSLLVIAGVVVATGTKITSLMRKKRRP